MTYHRNQVADKAWPEQSNLMKNTGLKRNERGTSLVFCKIQQFHRNEPRATRICVLLRISRNFQELFVRHRLQIRDWLATGFRPLTLGGVWWRNSSRFTGASSFWWPCDTSEARKGPVGKVIFQGRQRAADSGRSEMQGERRMISEYDAPAALFCRERSHDVVQRLNRVHLPCLIRNRNRQNANLVVVRQGQRLRACR